MYLGGTAEFHLQLWQHRAHCTLLQPQAIDTASQTRLVRLLFDVQR